MHVCMHVNVKAKSFPHQCAKVSTAEIREKNIKDGNACAREYIPAILYVR